MISQIQKDHEPFQNTNNLTNKIKLMSFIEKYAGKLKYYHRDEDIAREMAFRKRVRKMFNKKNYQKNIQIIQKNIQK